MKEKINKLRDYTELTQARNFSQRYEIKFRQPNTLSSFSATLFGEKRK